MDFSANSSSSEAINEGSQPYPYPYDVDPAGFDLMRLSGNDNYLQWKKNMLWWITEHNLVGFIDGTIKEPQKKKNGPKMKAAMTDLEAKHREWKRSDDLVKGWILYYLSEDIKGSVDYLFETANQLWNSLELASFSYARQQRTEFEEYLPLRRAIHMGDWEKAQEIFSQDISALTGVISSSEYRAIHLAIGNPKNIPFLKNLLEQIRPESLPTLVTDVQRSPLHLAAILDNRLAVKMLVEKNPYLLFTLDIHSSLPVNIAACYSHENTFRYLLKACKQHVELSQASGFYNPFEGEIGALLLGDTILAGFLGELIYYPCYGVDVNKGER
ncbi:hypothetical protein SSX86_031320 [Deinandra increscens subsp. villosa]|uniref:Retrotransposon Copia-like N-terminal domain-containing protein n=1 Tax=Deinandra increscens subsp. villosa TaxID=3103831 RepID=A0AAP0GHS9_9ASTR